jgi:hypothetical protein
MVEDKYERQDNRTLCERIGHDYKEISSRVKRWSVEEDFEVGGGSSCGADWEGANPDGPVMSSSRVHYRADVVTYQCSRRGCGDIITRTENESRE